MDDHLQDYPSGNRPPATDNLEAYLQDPAPPVVDDYLKLQHVALGEVLKLSGPVVGPIVTQIESRFQAETETARTESESTRARIESEFESATESARLKHQDGIEQIEAECAEKIGALDEDSEADRDQTVSQAESDEQDARKNCEYEQMLAEIVANGAAKRIEQERQDLERAVPTAVQRLQAMHEQADAVLRAHGRIIPAWQQDTEPDDSDMQDPVGYFRRKQELAGQYLGSLGVLAPANLFKCLKPFLLVALSCGLVAALIWLIDFSDPATWPWYLAIAVVAFLGAAAVVLLTDKMLTRRRCTQIADVYEPLRHTIATTQSVLEEHYKLTLQQLDQRRREAVEQRDEQARAEDEKLRVVVTTLTRRRDKLVKKIDHDCKAARIRAENQAADSLRQVNQEYQESTDKLKADYDRDLDSLDQRYRRLTKDYQDCYDSAWSRLAERWRQGLSSIESFLDATTHLDPAMLLDWTDPSWRQWTPSNDMADTVCFGRLSLDLTQLGDAVRKQAGFDLDLAEPVVLPALLGFPDHCSLLLQTQRQGREQALGTLRAVMARLFTSLRPGRAQFTIIDPIGLGQNFAGFMHAADYEERLTGGRIWTDEDQIQQRLVDLTGHMENVIQKYLRNEFETIEQYNQQAGQLAEPYRFLVIADFPDSFSDEAVRRLASIINSGARCGVYTLIMYDARQELPAGIDVEDLAANSIHLAYQDGRFVWQDEVYSQFPLTLDTPPDEEILTNLMHSVGKQGKDSTRVEVPFESVTPRSNEYWTQNSSAALSIPLGRTGATRLQYLNLGTGVAQHLLIAGKTGSGKSTLLHVIILNLSLWYSPDEVELYLIDFKRGVEFKTYVTHKLAHARAVAIESDREFGLSILRRLDAEMNRRGDLFRQAAVQDIAGYRQATGKTLPRTVLIVDEFQVFFAEDDKLAQDAALLLEQLVRQGRAFGIHVLLGSQTLGGAAGLGRSTMGQMAVRIALQCSETDSQLILNEDNVAARLLSRPGEAIYNDVGGTVVGNNPFQTAWLPDSCRDEHLKRLAALTESSDRPHGQMIVFEGNAPASIGDNRLLAACLAPSDDGVSIAAPRAWIGEPLAIKDPTAISLARRSGANVLIIGQRNVSALNSINAAMISLAAQVTPQAGRFVVLDGAVADDSHSEDLGRVASLLPHEHTLVPASRVAAVIDELVSEARRRQHDSPSDGATVYVIIYGLQQYRQLRRNDDDFAFSMDDQESQRPDRQFAELLREGPAVGIHVLLWVDTLASLERTLDRQTIREFDHRVLFQMSAADSSNLIDSPLANQLGLHRALLYSEETGRIEKFRPYAPAPPDWLQLVAGQLARKSKGQV